MQLVQVDVVNVERPQAGVDTLSDPASARITNQACVSVPQSALGGNDHLVTGNTSQRGREQLLGLAEAVSLSSVEEGDALVDGPPDGVRRRRGVSWPPFAAELPCAEGQARNHEPAAPQSYLLHGLPPSTARVSIGFSPAVSAECVSRRVSSLDREREDWPNRLGNPCWNPLVTGKADH